MFDSLRRQARADDNYNSRIAQEWDAYICAAIAAEVVGYYSHYNHQRMDPKNFAFIAAPINRCWNLEVLQALEEADERGEL